MTDKLSDHDIDRLIDAAAEKLGKKKPKGNGKRPEEDLSTPADIPGNDDPSAILTAVYAFVGRFIAYPLITRTSGTYSGSHTRT
jgi:hypothetical protein